MTGAPVRHGVVHHLRDLLPHDLGEGSTEQREVLREHIRGPTIDEAPAGDDRIAVEALRVAFVLVPVNGECVHLLERPGVDEQRDAFACGELAALMLCVDALLTATEGGSLLERGQVF